MISIEQGEVYRGTNSTLLRAIHIEPIYTVDNTLGIYKFSFGNWLL